MIPAESIRSSESEGGNSEVKFVSGEENTFTVIVGKVCQQVYELDTVGDIQEEVGSSRRITGVS